MHHRSIRLPPIQISPGPSNCMTRSIGRHRNISLQWKHGKMDLQSVCNKPRNKLSPSCSTSRLCHVLIHAHPFCFYTSSSTSTTSHPPSTSTARSPLPPHYFCSFPFHPPFSQVPPLALLSPYERTKRAFQPLLSPVRPPLQSSRRLESTGNLFQENPCFLRWGYATFSDGGEEKQS